jgi:acetylserotonin N-methyltransferase
MFTAVSLGIFDALHESPASAPELARRCACDAGALERLLDGCAGLGLLYKTEGRYSNTEEAEEFLRRDSARTMAGYILYSDRVLYPMWGHLDDAVREGSHRWAQTFGHTGNLFDSFFRTEEARETFLRGMHGFGQLSSPQVVKVFNLSGFRVICDLGGGTGHLAAAACERHGAMRGIVFDLPAACETARRFVAASPAAERLQLVAGDFFEDALPAADLYALGRILHDWSDAQVLALLRRVYEALPAGGGVLIAEALLDEDKCGPVYAQMQSLNMLICTEGRERTAGEYRELLEQIGFVSVESRQTGSPLDATLARKP